MQRIYADFGEREEEKEEKDLTKPYNKHVYNILKTRGCTKLSGVTAGWCNCLVRKRVTRATPHYALHSML